MKISSFLESLSDFHFTILESETNRQTAAQNRANMNVRPSNGRQPPHQLAFGPNYGKV